MTSYSDGPEENSDNVYQKPSLSSFGAPKRTQRQVPSSQVPSSKSSPVKPIRIDFGKRLAALMIDMLAGYLLALVITVIPFINSVLSLPIVIILYFLTRDFYFAGRGVGKNIIGLQVVDIKTGKPASLIQSVKRNIVLVAPYVASLIVDSISHLSPTLWLDQLLVSSIHVVGMVYCIIVIPLEAYRAYNRPDGLRIGDEFAGTTEVEAQMNFSNIVPH